jgi:hypothetical protein
MPSTDLIDNFFKARLELEQYIGEFRFQAVFEDVRYRNWAIESIGRSEFIVHVESLHGTPDLETDQISRWFQTKGYHLKTKSLEDCTLVIFESNQVRNCWVLCSDRQVAAERAWEEYKADYAEIERIIARDLARGE